MDNYRVASRTGIRALTALGAAALLLAWSGEAMAQEGPKPRGRIHLDYAAHDSDERDLPNGHRIRRARMGLSGKVAADWAYKIEVDFAENGVDSKDVYLQYRGFEAGTVTQGSFKVPFGMDELTSSNSHPLIERSLPSAFAVSRRVGLGFDTGGGSFTARVMAYGDELSSHGDRASQEVDEGFGAGARGTFAPVHSDAGVVHLGIALTMETPTGTREDEDPDNPFVRTVRFRQRPESRVSEVRLVDTGEIDDVDSLSRAGVELAWQQGPLLVQGEYLTVMVARGDADDVAFDGYYVHGSYMLGGEVRSYRGGVFGGPGLQADRGAWEVAARYSHINLNDGDIEGGEETNTTLGVNHYVNKSVRFLLNYVMVQSEQAEVEDNPNIILFRSQVSF